MAGQVPGVNDPSRAVPAFAGKFQRAVFLAVEIDFQIFDQELVERPGSLRDQLVYRGRIRRAAAGLHDILAAAEPEPVS